MLIGMQVGRRKQGSLNQVATLQEAVYVTEANQSATN